MLLFLSPSMILIALAVIPAVALMIYVYKADRLDKESPQLLRSLVLQGIFATAVASLIEMVGERVLGIFLSSRTVAYQAILYFAIVAFAEEGSKFVLLKNRTWRNPEFNCQFDGVVYAVFVSLGFALWENVRYVLSYGFQTALIRAVTAVPGHACFGVFMGVWYGVAKRFEGLRDPQSRNICLALSLLLPAITHGLYDYLAVMETGSREWIFFAFIAVLFFVSFRLVKSTSQKDKYIPRVY